MTVDLNAFNYKKSPVAIRTSYYFIFIIMVVLVLNVLAVKTKMLRSLNPIYKVNLFTLGEYTFQWISIDLIVDSLCTVIVLFEQVISFFCN